MRLEFGSWSEAGQGSDNQDRAMASPAHRCLCISDGMGGHSLGGQCAFIACKASIRSMMEGKTPRRAIDDANEAVMGYKARTPDADAFSGCTLLAARFNGETMEAAWVGDSIAMRLRDGELDVMTEPGRLIPFWGVLDSAIGMDNLTVRETSAGAAPGDVWAFCTDGVWDCGAGFSKMGEIIGGKPGDLAAMRLALLGSSRCGDDATCVIVRCREGSDA